MATEWRHVEALHVAALSLEAALHALHLAVEGLPEEDVEKLHEAAGSVEGTRRLALLIAKEHDTILSTLSTGEEEEDAGSA